MDKGYTIEVLGNSFVRYIDHFGSDERIVEAARISYKSPSKGPEKDKKLLKYLLENKHTSPFEQCNITFNIRLPIFVMRQLVRHRTFRLNEMSGRYTEMDLGFYVPEAWRIQDTKNKQGSTGDFSNVNNAFFSNELRRVCNFSFDRYRALLKQGVAREMARMVLPLNTLTEIYLNCDLNNLIKYFRLRDDGHAQLEHQIIAQAMKQITAECFPWTMELYNNG